MSSVLLIYLIIIECIINLINHLIILLGTHREISINFN